MHAEAPHASPGRFAARALLATLLLAAPAPHAQESAAAPKGSTSGAPSESPAPPQSGAASKPADPARPPAPVDTFEPSERIRVDEAVSFPTDI